MALLASTSSVSFSPFMDLNKNHRLRSRVLVRSVGGKDSVRVLGESVKMKGVNNRKNTIVGSYKKSGKNDPQVLEALWDDGYGSQPMKDYTKITMDLIKSDAGPPRWFCPVACGIPLKDSPLLLYLPGIDGTGTGLVLHEKSLGKVFHVQCLHIPVHDRTPFEGLIQIVEETVKIEHDLSPNKPIYLLGDSFGGTLALAVAARNPTLDLMLILANPATSYERSPLHPLVRFMRTLPDEQYGTFANLTSFFLDEFVKMDLISIDGPNRLQPLGKLLSNFTEYLPLLSVITTLLPEDTLKWRIQLVESAAAYANSRLHAITAQVLVLASGKDNLLPSKNEAQRLSGVLKHCKIRVFEENGHMILLVVYVIGDMCGLVLTKLDKLSRILSSMRMGKEFKYLARLRDLERIPVPHIFFIFPNEQLETGVNVSSAIKTTHMYRRSSKLDIIKDFLPPSMAEFKSVPMDAWWYRLYMGETMFSTMEDGKIVRGLAGIPDEGPVLLVGNHLLLGYDSLSLASEFLREKKVTLHGLAHPELFQLSVEYENIFIPITDIMKLVGSIPISERNFYKLLARKSHILLYPGGAREAFHRKGEGYKLFWPHKQEFVRMSLKFGATIIPFGVVGEDDISEIIIDYNEMKRIPIVDQIVNAFNEGRKNLREGMDGEIAKQQFHLPIIWPKLPGRHYYMFGKPIRTKGMENMLNDKDYLQELYLQIKGDVENNIAYLLTKREDDPYRGILQRLVWKMNYGNLDQIPSFDP